MTNPTTDSFTTSAYLHVERQADPGLRGDTRLVCRTDMPTLLAWGREPTFHDKNKAHRGNSVASIPLRLEWYGARSAADVTHAVDWPEGRELAEAYRRQFPDIRLPETRRVRRWGTDGDEFCRDRFDAGLDDCWQRRARGQVLGRGTLSLTVQIGGHCEVRASDLAWTGAAALAVIDAAEAAGIRLEVKAVSSVTKLFKGMCDTQHAIIDVKAASDPIDPATLTLAIASPAFFRYQVIHARGTLPWACRDNMGSTARVPADLQGELHLAQVRNRSDAEAEVSRLIHAVEQLALSHAA